MTILLALGAGLGAGATTIGGKKHEAPSATPAIREAPPRVKLSIARIAWPKEVRGVHVTMALAGLEGKIGHRRHAATGDAAGDECLAADGFGSGIHP